MRVLVTTMFTGFQKKNRTTTIREEIERTVNILRERPKKDRPVGKDQLWLAELWRYTELKISFATP